MRNTNTDDDLQRVSNAISLIEQARRPWTTDRGPEVETEVLVAPRQGFLQLADHAMNSFVVGVLRLSQMQNVGCAPSPVNEGVV